MEEKRIPKRSEIAEEYTWDLKDLFESDEAWNAEYAALGEMPARLAAFQGRLAESAETLLEFLRLEDELELRLSRLFTYACCASDRDTADSFYQDLRGRATAVYVAVTSAAAFAAPELMALDGDRLNLFYVVQPELETYRRPLYSIRRRAAHILSPEGERLLASAGEIAAAPDRIGSAFRDADIRFDPVIDAQGVVHPLSNATFVPLLESPDRELRRAVFERYYARMGSFRNTLAATLDAEFKQRRFFAAARRYEDTLSAALDVNEVPTEVYTKLIDAVHSNLDKMYRYVSLRKKCLGVQELHMWDVYTPLVGGAARRIGIDEAKATVLEALSVLGEDYTALLREGFEGRWLDVYENEGKVGGAYSTDSGRPHPYVLLNHKDTLDSLFTLAHEMGHALHSVLSCRAQPVCTSHYAIFVAEVASTCNEVLLMRHLLSKTSEKAERAALINHFLDSFKGTIYRQTMFAEFELILGRLAEEGRTLTAELLCEKYLALNRLYFGPSMISDREIALEWTRIPHFFYNYYVFQYATGFSAAVAIANRILSEDEAAVRDYKRFLSSGSSDDPISLLKLAGVDMSTPEPVNSALALFDELLGEMEKLI